MLLLSPYELQVYKSAFESPFSEKGKKKAPNMFLSWLPSGVSVPQMWFFTVKSKEPWARAHTQKTCVTRRVFFSSDQLLSRVRLFVTPWIAARQASLSRIYWLHFNWKLIFYCKNINVQTHRMYSRSVNLGSWCASTSPPVVTQRPLCMRKGGCARVQKCLGISVLALLFARNLKLH